MSDSKDDELVLCVQSSAVRDLFGGRTWLPCDEAMIDGWLPGVTKAFLPRSIAENDPSWRHICTYGVLTSADKVFAYRRGKSGSEGRLHGLVSIGVGGHVGIDDYDGLYGIGHETLDSATYRETVEELAITKWGNFRIAGLIADDSTPVNRVHLGVVYCMEVDLTRVKVREDCLAEPRWLTLTELQAERDQCETWSRIVLEHLLLPERSPSC